MRSPSSLQNLKIGPWLIQFVITWIRALMTSIYFLLNQALLCCDNQTTLYIATNPIYHEHIELDCHLVCDKLQEGSISTLQIFSVYQVVDLMTKSLNSKLFYDSFPAKMNAHNVQASCLRDYYRLNLYMCNFLIGWNFLQIHTLVVTFLPYFYMHINRGSPCK